MAGAFIQVPYYRRDLALVHHLGFGVHAAACAPGVVQRLAPVRARNGLVLELGCGSGQLTKALIAAGHRVIATDASPAMLEIAREVVGDGAQVRRLTLADERLPEADAIVAVGHPLNYLPGQGAFDRALIAIASALRPGGVLAFDVCDLQMGPGATARVDLRQARERLGDHHRILGALARPVHPRHHDLPTRQRRLVATRQRAARERAH
jgi:SAM-dependent methyltransferase